MSENITDALSKAGPPLAVSGLTFFGIALPELVQIVTAIYVTLMVVDKLYILYLRFKGKDGHKE